MFIPGFGWCKDSKRDKAETKQSKKVSVRISCNYLNIK